MYRIFSKVHFTVQSLDPICLKLIYLCQQSLEFMLLMAHHLLFFVLFLMLLISIIRSFIVGFMNKNLDFKKSKILSITILTAHLQLVFGVILFSQFAFSVSDFTSIMQDSILRFKYIEHPSIMLLAIIILSIGRVKAKKMEDTKQYARTIFTYFLIAFILILLRVPFDRLLVF